MARCARLAQEHKHKFDLKLCKKKLADLGFERIIKSAPPWLAFDFIYLGWQPWQNT